jgi:hypothetical protein
MLVPGVTSPWGIADFKYVLIIFKTVFELVHRKNDLIVYWHQGGGNISNFGGLLWFG